MRVRGGARALGRMGLAWAWGCALLALLWGVDARHQCSRPGVVQILTDDQGLGEAGFMGHHVLRGHTPHLDALARGEGTVLFSRFRSSSGTCSPTRGALLTGRAPWRMGLVGVLPVHRKRSAGAPGKWEDALGIPTEEVTLADVLRDRGGYRTGHFGKWHLGRFAEDEDEEGAGRGLFAPPWRRGFDTCYSTPANQPRLPEEEADGFTFWDVRKGPGGKQVMWKTGMVEQGRSEETSHTIFRRATAFITEAVGAGECFYASIMLFAPHQPYQLQGSRADRKRFRAPFLRMPGLDADAIDYFARIKALDAALGEFLAALDDLGVQNSTILTYSSDNGKAPTAPSVGDDVAPRLSGKKGNQPKEGSTRVIGLVHWPSIIPGVHETRMPATDLDFFPTILEAARIRYSHGRALDGESLIPLLLDPASFGTSRRHTEIPFLSHLGGSLVSRNGRYKLAIQDFSKARTQCRYAKLFDLETDPGEEFDLLKEGGSGSRARANSMLKRYARWREDVYRSFLGYDYGQNTTWRVPFAPEDRKSFNAMTFDPNARPQRPVALDAWLGCGEGNAGCAPWGCP